MPPCPPRQRRAGQQAQPAFWGYPQPTSNTTYVPNQFFDVVLRHSSRGCVRLVSYLIRKTLGWCDEHGNPRETTIAVSHRELAKLAGISRGALSSTINEAIEKGYIKCILAGKPAEKNSPHTTGAFQLNWDKSSSYTTKPEEFRGFFAGNGNRTYVPNAFFDHTIKNESLAVSKTVGAIIRHTIGFQNEYGFRRQQVQKSYKDLENITGLSPRHLNKAIAEALAKNHISIVEKGYFDPNAGKNSRSSIYGLHWEDQSGSKRIAEEIPLIQKERPKKDSGEKPTDSKRIAEQRAKKDSETGPKKSAEKRLKKDSDIEIKPKNKTTKVGTADNVAGTARRERALRDGGDMGKANPTASSAVQVGGRKALDFAVVAFERLIKEGFDEKSARFLVNKYPGEQIIKQSELLDKRSPSRNRLGMLRTAIEENWAAPVETQSSKKIAQRIPVYQPKHIPSGPDNSAELLLIELAALEQQLPGLFQEFRKYEEQERAKIENMPMVSAELIAEVIKAFDSADSRLRRLREFSNFHQQTRSKGVSS